MIRESLIEKRLVAAVKSAGGVAYKFTSPARSGVPDRIVILPGGRVTFVEVKSPGGCISEIQKVEIARLRSLGCRVVVVHDSDGIERVLCQA